MGERKRPEWVDQAIRWYTEDGLSLNQIADRVRRSFGAVWYQLKRTGVQLRSCKEGTRLRRWKDTRTENLTFEPDTVTIGLISYSLGDGHFNRDGCSVRYGMKTSVLRDYLSELLQGLGLSSHTRLRSNSMWYVEVCDVRWWEFCKRFADDFDYLRENALKWPDHFVYGFFAAEGHHTILPNGAVVVGFSNKKLALLELVAECLEALGYQTTLVGPAKDGCYQLNLRGSSLAKVQFAVNSPYPNKRASSNYLLRRHLVKPELQKIYDEALEELYATYGKERVDRELLQAKRTKRV